MVQYRNPNLIAERTRMDSNSALGPASYLTASKPTITLNNLRNIDNINDVVIQARDNAVFLGVPVSISGNVVTYLVAEGTAGANAEVVDTTVLNGVTFEAIARGQ